MFILLIGFIAECSVFNAIFVTFIFVYIVKRAGMRATRASFKIVSFSLDLVVI